MKRYLLSVFDKIAFFSLFCLVSVYFFAPSEFRADKLMFVIGGYSIFVCLKEAGL